MRKTVLYQTSTQTQSPRPQKPLPCWQTVRYNRASPQRQKGYPQIPRRLCTYGAQSALRNRAWGPDGGPLGSPDVPLVLVSPRIDLESLQVNPGAGGRLAPEYDGCLTRRSM